MTGAVGHISCEMIVDINTEVVRLMSTIQEFSDPAVVIEDARREAAEIFSAIKGLLLIELFCLFLTSLLFRQRFHSNGFVCWSYRRGGRGCPQQSHLGAQAANGGARDEREECKGDREEAAAF